VKPAASPQITPPYRVFFVIGSLNKGGTELRLLDVIRRLNPAAFTPVLFAAKGGELLPAVRNARVYSGPPGANVLFSLPSLWRALRRERPTVVWCVNQGIASFFGRLFARLLRTPVIMISLHGADTITAAMDRYNAWLTRRFTDRVVVVNRQYVQQLKKQRLPEEKITVLYNGVDETLFSPAAPERRQALKRELLGIDPQRPVIGTVANLRPIKALDVLIRAAARLRQTHPDALFIIIGEGRQRPALEQLCADYDVAGNVRLLGTRSDVPELMRAFDIYALTSDYEGCPNTILEAMASGLPVVATRVGGVPELLPPEAGILVPPRDETALAGALRRLLDDPGLRREMGRQARAHIEAHFTMQQMIAGREALLLELIAAKT